MYSVLMSVYSGVRPHELEAAIDSILNQTMPTDDFVIVEDGPVSSKLEEVILKAVAKRPGVIHLEKLDHNCGTGIAKKYGLSFCKHELIANQDADDISFPDRCEKQVKAFREHPETDVISGTVYEFVGSPKRVTAARELPTEPDELKEFARKRNPINNPCVMYRKGVIEKAGGFQDFYLLEDYFLYIRILLAGGVLRNLKEPILYMRAGDEMYKRRGGKKYAEAQKKLFRYMLDHDFITKQEYRKSVMIRTLSAMAPAGLRKAMFKRFNRKGVKSDE